MRLPWLADVLRAAGLAVVEVGDWQNRGDDLRSVEGIVWHHTVTGPRTSDQAVARLLRDGRPDLAGPLSQLGLDRAGRYHVVAAGKANHNGYGLWGNQSIGIEAYNDGVGEPWPDVQVAAYITGTRALLGRLGLGVDRVKGHKETDPRRKIDPAGLDMDEMRTRIATDQGDEFDMATIEELKNLLGEWEKDTRTELRKVVDGQTDQIDRYTVWSMRRDLKADGLTDKQADAKIVKVLGKSKLPAR